MSDGAGLAALTPRDEKGATLSHHLKDEKYHPEYHPLG
jgi:hypothetical protein